MIGATVINIVNGMAAFAMPTAVLGLMAAYVVWGRWRSARAQTEKRKTKTNGRWTRRKARSDSSMRSAPE
jgi:preprotein translocase subunit Sec63